LEALNNDLVGETTAPKHVSLWLRRITAPRGKGSANRLRTHPLGTAWQQLLAFIFAQTKVVSELLDGLPGPVFLAILI
jgi:hypothetical protein